LSFLNQDRPFASVLRRYLDEERRLAARHRSRRLVITTAGALSDKAAPIDDAT